MNQSDSHRELVKELWLAGVARVRGDKAIKIALQQDKVNKIDYLIVIGKAAESMFIGAKAWLAKDAKVLIITKYGHVSGLLEKTANLEVLESGHPIPDKNSLLAGKKLVSFVQSIPGNKTLFMLISGGASALAEHLPDEFSFKKLKQITQTMIENDLDIEEINTVRIRVSNIKGGKLFQHFNGTDIKVYAISDVPTDDIRIIGSGIGSNITMQSASLPSCVNTFLQHLSPEENLTTDKVFQYKHHIIASNKLAREAIVKLAEEKNLTVRQNMDCLSQNINQAANIVIKAILSGKPGVYIYGGEPTLELPEKPGSGGRNQHFALLIAQGIQNREDITVIVAGTDGSDGPTKYAGAIVDGEIYNKDADVYINNADSGSFLAQQNALFSSGPTGTNVMDLIIALKV